MRLQYPLPGIALATRRLRATPLAFALSGGAHALILAPCLLSACAADKQYSQTELSALQSREFDAPYEATYTAAVNALFDAGYIINSSDKDAGFVAASRVHGGGLAAYLFHGVQIKVDAAGRRTSVRVSTTDGAGQQQVNKEVIDELLDLIDRRLVGDLTTPQVGPPTVAPGAKPG